MKVLMLGWELPPHNSGGLGVACYQLCKALAQKGVDIDFIVPYTADHSLVDFMRVHAAHDQTAEELLSSGTPYDSFAFKANKRGQKLTIHDQQTLFETAVGKLVPMLDFDIIHAHDLLTFRAGIRARLLTGKPLIAHVQSRLVRYGLKP